MRQYTYYGMVIVLFAGGCEQHKPLQRVEKVSEAPSVTAVATSNNIIDYKKDKYRFFIGQEKDSVDKIIDLRHNYLADDGIINDGVTHYMNIGEDLIVSYDKEEVLPALFFTTDKKKVTAFSCSIVCGLYDKKRTTISACIDSFVPYFSALKLKSSRKKLVDRFSLVIQRQGFIEEFKVDTTAWKYQFIFSYEKALKQNGY